MRKKRKVGWPQRRRAKREMLAAIGVYRDDGYTKEGIAEIVQSMYDFQSKWDKWSENTRDKQKEDT